MIPHQEDIVVCGKRPPDHANQQNHLRTLNSHIVQTCNSIPITSCTSSNSLLVYDNHGPNSNSSSSSNCLKKTSLTSPAQFPTEKNTHLLNQFNTALITQYQCYSIDKSN
jgi:hypothetical protein